MRLEDGNGLDVIAELSKLLTAMGAQVHGAGTDRLEIEGVAKLNGVDHSVWGDRIEIGTLLAAGMITRGVVCVRGADAALLTANSQDPPSPSWQRRSSWNEPASSTMQY